MSHDVLDRLRRDGFAHIVGGFDRVDYLRAATLLGMVLSEEQIALRPGAHAYVAKPGRVPFHTDHPEVDVIGWLCEAQDESDGASLLVDALPVVDALPPPERDRLRRVRIACPPLAGGPPTGSWPVLRPSKLGDAVFCSPWLNAIDATDDDSAVLERFRAAISVPARTPVAIRLAPGDALFVDNRRVLHGRDAIAAKSRRRLRRIWLRANDAAFVAA